MTATLIFGAAGERGAAITRRLIEHGHRLALVRGAENVHHAGADAATTLVGDDPSSPQGARDSVRRTVDAFGRLDALVFIAPAVSAQTVSQISANAWHEALHASLTTPFLLAQAALEALATTQGSMVAIGRSCASHPPVVAGPVQAAVASGLAMLIKSIAVDHGPDGIRANYIQCGDERSTGGDVAAPDQIAQTVAWLLSSDASYITGSVIPVAGGNR